MAGIYTNLNKLNEIKNDIRTSLEEKGVDMTNVPFEDYVDEITPLFKSVNVGEYGIKLKESTFTTIPKEFDFSDVTDMSNMFNHCENLETANFPNTEKVTNMKGMFSYCTNLKNIENLNTTNVVNFNSIFSKCENLESIPELDTHNATDMLGMFIGCTSLKTIPQIDTSNAVDVSYLFDYCENLESIPQLDTSNAVDMRAMFSHCKKIREIPQLDCTNVTNMSNMFEFCENLTEINSINYLKNTYNVVDMTCMFRDCGIAECTLDTSSLKNALGMFGNCKNLYGLGQMNFSFVTSMGNFFKYGGQIDYVADKLMYLGGFVGLSCNWADNNGLVVCPNLVDESLINVVNGLAEFSGVSRSIKFSTNHQQRMEELGLIEQATNKGWNVLFG